MKPASTELNDLLMSGVQLALADLYTFTLNDKVTKIRYTSHDRPLSFNSVTWGLGPRMERGGIRTAVGVTVDTLDMTMSLDPSVTYAGQPLLQFVAGGGFDGAQVTLEQCFAPDWASDIVGTLLLFTGRISDIETDRYGLKLQAKSPIELLDTPVPRNLYSAACLNTVYDEACGAIKTVYPALVQAGSPTRLSFNTSIFAPSGTFDLGVVEFVTGPNAGLRRSVRKFANTGGRITLVQPLVQPPNPGDEFTIYPGCDKTRGTCNSRFANLSRFRGAPYIPVPETVT